MTLDAIVIGAGVAGLAAAIELQKAGLTFVVLEARDRAGGRIFNVKSKAGRNIELGAEFLHGSVPALMDVVTAANLQYQEASNHHLALNQGKMVDADEYFRNTQEILTAMSRYADGADMTFSEFGDLIIKENPTLKDAVEQTIGYTEDLNACYANKVSIAWLANAQRVSQETDGERFFRLVNGYGRLVDHLVSKLPAGSIKLSHAVETVHWKQHHVLVQAGSDGKRIGHEARAAIITLPVGVLQDACIPERRLHSSVRFDPPLDEKLNALKSIVMGKACRITLEFKSRLWEHKSFGDFGFIHSRSLPFTTWWTQAPAHTPILIAWAAGPKADALLGKSNDEIVELVLTALSDVLDLSSSELKDELVEAHYHDWTNDPFTLGAYSHVLAGGMDAARQLAIPIENTLYFAGEATETDGFSGTVAGALKSGVRAARELVQSSVAFPKLEHL